MTGFVSEQFRLDGKVALTTGGSRGLGLEIAQALSEAGAKVSLVARREEFFVEAREAFPDALTLLADVSDEAHVQRVVAETAEKLGTITILVNCAGITWKTPAMEMTAENFQKVMSINVNGTFYACKAVAPAMEKQGYGKIVNVSSTAGLVGSFPEMLDAVGYATSKGAVNSLTRDLAAKWGRFGIRVNALAPGFFPTRMTEKVLAAPGVQAALGAFTPLGRHGNTGELGGSALYLASPASDYVTGQVLVVNGGTTIV